MLKVEDIRENGFTVISSWQAKYKTTKKKIIKSQFYSSMETKMSPGEN